MSLNVLSLSFGHDGAASVIVNGKLKSHITSERITRFKKQRGVNKKVIKYVLDKANLTFNDIDIVAVCNWFWDRDSEGKELFDKEAEGFSVVKENGIAYNFDDYRQFYNDINMSAQGVYNFVIDNKSKPCFMIDHHFAHAAYSYYMSPFNEAYSMSLDVNDNMGNGHSIYYFNNDGDFRLIRKGGDFAVGGFYSQMCEYLGFYPSLTDAGKVMALAAYNKDKVNDHLHNIVWPDVVRMGDIYHGDQYQHLMAHHGIKDFPSSRFFFPQLKGEGGKADPKWLDKKDWDSELSKQIAADTQYILENSVSNMLHRLFEYNRISKNICFSGGTFLNCVMNGELANTFKDINMFAAPACGDDGLTIGAGIFLSLQLAKNKQGQIVQKKSKKVFHSIDEIIEGGKKYNKKEIQKAIENYKDKLIVKECTDEEIYHDVSCDLINKQIIGWFQGGSEIGPRALGKRSILANATDPTMKDNLNDKVKHREGFRPFAPMILEEKAHQWFEFESSNSPYMLFSYKCKNASKIPSAVHIDGTARIQTLNKENGKIYELLYTYNENTGHNGNGIPVIINTSFNIAGEPIVETPEDAIKCFLGTAIDVLVLENFIIRKRN